MKNSELIVNFNQLKGASIFVKIDLSYRIIEFRVFDLFGVCIGRF